MYFAVNASGYSALLQPVERLFGSTVADTCCPRRCSLSDAAKWEMWYCMHMEMTPGHESAHALPNELLRETREWLDCLSDQDIIVGIYETYPIAADYDLSKAIIEYGDQFKEDSELSATGDRAAFRQGMLYGIAITYPWLIESEWMCAPEALAVVKKELTEYEATAAVADGVQSSPQEILLAYGQQGLDHIRHYRDLIDAAASRIAARYESHEHFMAGAGLMARIVTAARTMHRDNEIKSLYAIFEMSGAEVVQNAGRLAAKQAQNRQRRKSKSRERRQKDT